MIQSTSSPLMRPVGNFVTGKIVMPRWTLTSTLLICCLLSFQSDPVSEAADAAAHAATITPTDVRYVRWFSTHNLVGKERDDAVSSMRFWCNSLSQRHRIGQPHEATDSLWWVDLRDFGWTQQQWAEVAKEDKYFSVFYDRQLYALTGEYYPVMRLDYFLATTSADPIYSRMLGLPNTLKQLKAQFFVQEEGVKKLSLAQGGAVLKSIVALHNRQLERWPTITGYFWQTREALNNRERKNVLEPDNYFSIDFDGQEFIWRLPNGLQGYWLGNAQEKQVNVVPPDIAQDKVSPYRDMQVRNARSCVSCHPTGINPLDDVISKMIRARPDDAKLNTIDKEVTEAIEDFYLSDLGRQIKRDQESYEDAVKLVNGLTPEKNATAYTQQVYNYIDRFVDLATASRELGVDKEWFDALAQSSGTVGVLKLGGEEDKIARDAWEDQYPSLLRLKYKLRELAKKGETDE